MADLSDIQAAGFTKIVGSDATGLETNIVNADANGNLQTINPSDGPVTPGTAASKSALAGLIFNTVLPTLTNSQQASLQADSAARLIIAPLTNTSVIKAQLQDNAGAAITLGQKGISLSIPIVIASDQSSIPVKMQDGSGTALTSTLVSSKQSLDVNIANSISISPLPASGSGFCFGQLNTSTSVAYLAVESTAYTEPTTNSTMTIVSSSASDSSAGTGARTVTVTYLDQTGAGPFTTVFTMNGTTVVTAGVSNMCFIEKITVSTIGSTGSNVGILTLKTGGGATVGTIAATVNQTLWTHHYVPTSKTCYISGFSVGNNATAAGNGAQFILKSSTPTISNTPEIQINDTIALAGVSNTTTRSYLSAIQVVGPARVRAYVLPYANAATSQFASFDFIDN